MLKEATQNDSIEDIRSDYQLEVADIQNTPALVAPYLQRHVRNAVAASCSTDGRSSWSGSNLTLMDALLNARRDVPSARYTQCVNEAKNAYVIQRYGEDSLAASILNSVGEPTSNQNPHSVSDFLSRNIFSQSPSGGQLDETAQLFADDVFSVHRYLSESSTSRPDGSIVRLTPWAFPNWPSGMTVQEMTLGAFLEMVNPKSFSFEALALSLNPNEGGPTQITTLEASNWTRYTSNASQLSHFYSSDLNDYVSKLSVGESIGGDVVRPNASTSFERSRDLLCGHQPSLEMSAVVQSINDNFLQTENSHFSIGSFLEANGIQLGLDYQGCLRHCADPLLNFGPDCMTTCLVPEEPTALSEGPIQTQGTGVCDNMNATYRDACIRNLWAEQSRAIEVCERRFGINPNAPDRLDFSQLNSIQDCQAFSEITAYNCRRYFEERGAGSDVLVSSNEDTARQCIARYCGAFSTDPELDKIDAFNQEAARRREEEIRRQIQVSEEERESVVLPAIQRAANKLSDDYTVTFGRGQPSEGTRYPSRAHLFGAAQDISISRNDGSPPTPEDYEAVAARIVEELPDGFQVISELRLVDAFPNGINVESISPSEVSYSYTPIFGIDAASPRITVPAREIGVMYLHSGKANTRYGVQEFFDYDEASGNHLHVGRPGGSLPNL